MQGKTVEKKNFNFRLKEIVFKLFSIANLHADHQPSDRMQGVEKCENAWCVNEKISICARALTASELRSFRCWCCPCEILNVQTKDHNSSKIVYRCAIARFRFPLSSVHAADIEDVVVVEEDVYDDDERQRRRRQSCAQIFIYLAVFFFSLPPHIRLK